MADVHDLDDRKAAILRAVVTEYISTAQPVGSGKIAARRSLDVSSATVRNELGFLESEGYLHKPHTSAGRVPTDKGYRFFVDQMSGTPQLGPNQNIQVREFFDQTHSEIESMLRDTTRLLTGLTDCAAVITGPGRDVATIRSAQLVALHAQNLLAVLVLSNGAVAKRTFEADIEPDEKTVAAASAKLNDAMRGATLAALPACDPSGDPVVDDIVALAHGAFADEVSTDPVYVGGRAQVAESFEAVDTVREVLGLLERQFIIVGLIRDVLGRGMSVAIGNETGVDNLAECSLVVAPYEVEGEPVGTIGLLGPTRMNYSRALAAVAVVGTSLGDRLTAG